MAGSPGSSAYTRAVSAPRAWPSLVAALVVLLLGAVVAAGLGQALGLSFTPSATPAPVSLSRDVTPPVPAPRIGRIDVPPGERVALAATAVADALVDRGRPRPTVSARAAAGADLVVRLGGAARRRRRRPSGSATSQGRYALEAAGPGRRRGGAVRDGRPDPVAAAVVTAGHRRGDRSSPRLGLRLTDSGLGRAASPTRPRSRPAPTTR